MRKYYYFQIIAVIINTVKSTGVNYYLVNYSPIDINNRTRNGNLRESLFLMNESTFLQSKLDNTKNIAVQSQNINPLYPVNNNVVKAVVVADLPKTPITPNVNIVYVVSDGTIKQFLLNGYISYILLFVIYCLLELLHLISLFYILAV
jgi:hypothetical protein